MKDFGIKINDRVEIVRKDKIYESAIQDIKEDGFLISAPISLGQFVDFNEIDELTLTYLDSKKTLYKFKSKLLGKAIQGRVRMFKISLPFKIEKIQRRDFVRVDHTVPIKYGKVREDGVDDFKGAVLIDISGGGIRAKLKEKLNYGDKILFNMVLEGETISALGQIIRKELCDDGRSIYGARFLNLPNGEREKIIRVVFKIMRRQRELV